MLTQSIKSSKHSPIVLGVERGFCETKLDAPMVMKIVQNGQNMRKI
jgi:hypothetical protein